MSRLGCCCLVSIAASVCLLVFFWLHTVNTERDGAYPWLAVFAPALLLAIVVLVALLSASLILPQRAQPSPRSWATWGLGALAAGASCVRLVATADGGAAPFGWPAVLLPLGAMLIARAVTIPPLPSPARGAPEAAGLGCWRLLSRLELPLGAASLVLLYWQLTTPSAARGWWAVAAPLLLLEALSALAGLRAVGSTAEPSKPPLARAGTDRVDWVRLHERRAIGVGLGAFAGGLLRIAVLCSLAGQLDALAAAADAAPGTAAPASIARWSDVYRPYAWLLSLILCCCCCCCACAPSQPQRHSAVAVAEHSHAHSNGFEKERLRARGGDGPSHSRAASSSSNEGTSPLLPPEQRPEGAPSAKPSEQDASHSPHLL